MAAAASCRTPGTWRRTATAQAPRRQPPAGTATAPDATSYGLRGLRGLCVSLHHLMLQRAPDFAVQLVELLLHPHLGNIARARQRYAPVADDARAGTCRH